MPQPSLLLTLGAKGQKESRYAPVWTDRYFVGYWSNRNPLRSPLSTLYADGWHLGGSDALLSGQNVELSPRLTLCRRPGNIAYSTATFPTPPLTFYPFRLFGATSTPIDVIVDTASTIYTLTPTSKTAIFTKSAGAGQANFLGIAQTLYFGDGVEQMAFQNNVVRNWGIVAPSGTGAASAYTGLAADVGGGTEAWTSPANAQGPPDGAYATLSFGGVNFTGNTLRCSTYGFSGLSGAITGIGVVVTWLSTTNLPSITPNVNLQLSVNGGLAGSIKATPFPGDPGGGTPTSTLLGGASDLWGIPTISLAAAEAVTFGVSIIPTNTTAYPNTKFATLNIDSVQIIVYLAGPVGASPSGSGSFSAVTGYEYVAAYGNSASGAISSATPPSVSTGPFTNQGEVDVTLTASTDPQVNQIWVFRTTDGGDTFLNLPNSPFPNVSGTVADSAPDSQLNILQQAPVNYVNNPPPAGSLDPVYYLNLVWTHVGNTVYFTRVASTIVGNTNEAFPPANVFAFPETVIRKVPISTGLLIFTTSNIYIILGNNTSASVLYSAPFLSGYGIETWNALWLDGSNIYFFTSDNRLVELNPSSGVSDLGFPIGDQLAKLNPSNVYVTYHSSTSNDVALYVGDGSTGWYRCNPYQAPDQAITGPVWSVKAGIVGGLQALVAMETAPGVHQLMMGGSGANEPVLVRDSSYTTFTDNGSAYPANFVVGSIVLAQPGQRAKCRFVTCDFVRTGTSPIVSVLLGEVSGTFQSISGYTVPDPSQIPASTSVFNNRYYFKQSVGSLPPKPVVCRYLQIKIDFGTDTVQNEILSSTINGAIEVEK